MVRHFVEPRVAPMGNSFADLDDHKISPDAMLRRHSFGDYVPHALVGYPTHGVLPKEAGCAKIKGSKKAAVQRAKAPMANLRRRRTTGSCAVAQDPDGDVAETLESGRWSLASESTQWIGSEGVFKANSLDSSETLVAKEGSSASLPTSTSEKSVASPRRPGPPAPAWAELEAESRRLAEGAREAYARRLAARSVSQGVVTEGQQRPTLLTSRPKEVAAGGRASRVAAAAVAKLPVLLGSRGGRAAKQKAEEPEKGAVVQQPEVTAATAQAREARSLGASARAAFMERQRRISQRFERCLAAFMV